MPPQSSLQSIKTDNRTEISSGTSTNQRGQHGSSLTGPLSEEASPPSLLSASSLLLSGSPSAITGRPTGKLVEPSFTSSSSYHRDTTATMTTTKNIPRPFVPLPGIRACPPSFPRPCMSESVDMRVTQGSSPGSNSSTRHRIPLVSDLLVLL